MQASLGNAQRGARVRINNGFAVQCGRFILKPKLHDVAGIHSARQRWVDEDNGAFTVGNQIIGHQGHANMCAFDRFGLAIYFGWIEYEDGVVRWG
ncbi:hypothetical protein SRM1_01414 [Pseudomonas fluorescens]|nr:hypothetical protein SRM1_01414 [Pseudomonas fluorescens]